MTFGDAVTAGVGLTFLGYLEPGNNARELAHNFFSPTGSLEARPKRRHTLFPFQGSSSEYVNCLGVCETSDTNVLKSRRH